MHELFKNWLYRYTHDKSHLGAFDRALSKDLMGHVYVLYMRWDNAEFGKRACAEVGLRRLTVGGQGMILDDLHTGVSELRT